MIIQDRLYQYDAVAECEQKLAEKTGAVLLVMPTGTGKTATASKIICNKIERGNDRPIFLAPRREIVKQTADTLVDFGVDPGVIMSGLDYYRKRPCHVASIDTLRSWIRSGKVHLNHEDTCFVDEAHRSISATYRWLIEAYLDAGADVLGMTATAIRSDGVGLGQVYSHLVIGISMVKAIKEGWLVKPAYRIPYVPDLSDVPVVAGEFDRKKLEEALNKKVLVGDLVDYWVRHDRGRPTLVFASGVKHSIAIAEEFQRVGINMVHIDGTTDHRFRDDMMKVMRRGEMDGLVSCGVFTEGTDIPNIGCIVDAGATMSLGKHLQKLGRGGRPQYADGFDLNTVDGRLGAIAASAKPDFTINDHAGNFYRNGRMDRNIQWELCDGKEIVEKAREKREKSKVEFTCQECNRVFSGQVYCPFCGTKIVKYGKMRDYIDADLVALTNEQFRDIENIVTEREKREFYLGVLYWAREIKAKKRKSDPDVARRKDGFAAVMFKEKFGDWPPQDWPFMDPIKPSIEVLNYIRYQNIKYTKRKQKEAQT